MRQLLITTTLLAVGLSMAYPGKSALEKVSENISQENDEEGETQLHLQENNVMDRLYDVMDDRMTQRTTIEIQCGSIRGSKRFCPTGGSVVNVKLETEDSGFNTCKKGKTFGFSDNKIWVDKGCSGKFIAEWGQCKYDVHCHIYSWYSFCQVMPGQDVGICQDK